MASLQLGSRALALWTLPAGLHPPSGDGSPVPVVARDWTLTYLFIGVFASVLLFGWAMAGAYAADGHIPRWVWLPVAAGLSVALVLAVVQYRQIGATAAARVHQLSTGLVQHYGLSAAPDPDQLRVAVTSYRSRQDLDVRAADGRVLHCQLDARELDGADQFTLSCPQGG